MFAVRAKSHHDNNPHTTHAVPLSSHIRIDYAADEANNNCQYAKYPLPHTQLNCDATYEDTAESPPRKPMGMRVARLFVFYVLNLCLGTLLWTPSLLLALLTLPLWCQRDVSSCATPAVLVKTATAFAKLDIRLANSAVAYLRAPKPSIRLSPRLEAGNGPAVARVFVYLSAVKLLVMLGSFVAIYGTVGTVLLAILSNGAHVGLPGVHASYADSPVEYVALLLLRFVIGCLCVLRSVPRAVLATKFFCDLRDSEREAAALNSV